MAVKFVILLFLTFVTVQGYPAVPTDKPKNSAKDDVELLSWDKQFSNKGNPVIELDAGGNFENTDPQINNFFGNLESILSAMTNRINKLFSSLPANENLPLPNFPVPNFPNLDLGKGNTTSVTKVINGHKVTINDTDYRKEGQNETAFFHVRVVDVHPDPNSLPPTDLIQNIHKELAEDSDSENEISKNKGEEVGKPEKLILKL